MAGSVTTLLVRINYRDNQDKIEWQVGIGYSGRSEYDTVAGSVTALLVRIKYCSNQDKVEWQFRIG